MIIAGTAVSSRRIGSEEVLCNLHVLLAQYSYRFSLNVLRIRSIFCFAAILHKILFNLNEFLMYLTYLMINFVQFIEYMISKYEIE